MKLHRLILPAAVSVLLLTGCGADAVKGLSRGGTAETDNFCIQIPHSLYKAEKPESALWDQSFLDRSGYMISVQDFDFGYAPEDFLGQEYEEGEAAFEQGTLGQYPYCGWAAPAGENCVLKYAAGTQGRLLFAQATVPRKKASRAKLQMLDLLGHMEFTGRPLGAGSISAGFAQIDYPETWVVSAKSFTGCAIMHPAVNKDGVYVSFTVTETPKASAKELAEESIAATTEQLPDYYTEAAVVKEKLLGYDAYIARLRSGEPKDPGGAVILDTAYIEAPQGVCIVSMNYGDPGADVYFAALNTLTLTFNGE